MHFRDRRGAQTSKHVPFICENPKTLAVLHFLNCVQCVETSPLAPLPVERELPQDETEEVWKQLVYVRLPDGTLQLCRITRRDEPSIVVNSFLARSKPKLADLVHNTAGAISMKLLQ